MRIPSHQLRDLLKLYFIMGSQNTDKDPRFVLEEAIQGGITLFQFREKGEGAKTGGEKEELARSLMQLCRNHGIPFIVNDDIDLAIAIDADGVHVGQDDEDVAAVRERIGDKILGVSAHTLKEVEEAIEDGADYLGIGPIFPTGTKPDAKKPQGDTLIRAVRKEKIDIPIVGIGGITAENASFVIQSGADGISLISAISQAASPKESSKQLLERIMVPLAQNK
ncbi:thiamine phosphate synthase [Falsibacillus albus]|nr:thiamine phosphate synthase [Falsibacillus albus]